MLIDPEKKPEKTEEKKVGKQKYKNPITRDSLFDEILTQNTYTDIIDMILKYTKSIKATP